MHYCSQPLRIELLQGVYTSVKTNLCADNITCTSAGKDGHSLVNLTSGILTLPHTIQ